MDQQLSSGASRAAWVWPCRGRAFRATCARSTNSQEARADAGRCRLDFGWVSIQERVTIMGAFAVSSRLSVEDYLAGEEIGEIRNEYVGGEVYAMTGASRAHGLIALNLGAFLRPLLRGGDCQAFVSDMKVRLQIAGDDVFYYPDLVMTCDPDDRASDYCQAPCLVVEILSPKTRRIDRREKFLAYTSIPSLRGYLLVSQDRRQVELFRREHGWNPEVFHDGAVPLTCLEAMLPLEAVYEGVDLG